MTENIMRCQLCFEIKKIMYSLHFHIFSCVAIAQCRKKQNTAKYNDEPNKDMKNELAECDFNEVT